jgi:hypothetical protein
MVENISSSAVASSVSGTDESSPRRSNRQRHHHRKPPQNAILDPTFLRDRLDLSERHLSAFYLALHQQNYPATLREFLAAYHHEKDDIDNEKDHDDADSSIAAADPAITSPSSCSPPSGAQLLAAEPPEPMHNCTIKADLHSKKMKKKNHKMQLPKRFLEFLNTIAGDDEDADDDDGTKKNKSNNSDASSSSSSSSRLFLTTSTVHSVQHSANTLTTKLIIQLHDGMLIESVIMRYDQKTTIPRASLCVSSQVGCAMGCTFCATGTMGKIGNLGVAEILEQVIHANRILRMEPGRPSVRNVVFMGMGEVRTSSVYFL